MAEYEQDTLVINISANTKNADDNIKSITSSLSKLKDVLDNGNIEAITNTLERIAGIDFSNVSNGLRDVADAFRSLNKLSTNSKKLNFTFDMPRIENFDIPEQIEKMPVALEKTKIAFDDVENTALNLEYLTNETTNSITLQESELRNIDRDTKNVNKNLKEQKGWWEKIGGTIKRIILYRLIREIFQQILNLIREAFRNLYEFSKEMGGAFAPAVDSIKSSITYLANSLMAILAPLIEVLAPILTQIVDLAAQVANAIAKMMAVFLGAKNITQATKSLEEFNQKSKNTNKLSIDELNVLDDQKNNYAEMFTIAENTESAMSSVKNILNEISGLISSVVEVLNSSGLLDLLDLLLKGLNAILAPIAGIIKSISGPLTNLLATVLKPIVQIISTIATIIVNVLTPVFEYFGEVLKGELGVVLTLFSQIAQGFSDFINIFKAVFDLIGAIFTGNTEAMRKAWDNLWAHIGNFFIGQINGLLKGFEAFVNFIIDAINGFTELISNLWTWAGLPAIGKIPHITVPQINYIPTYAKGGIVEDGLFMANHNELVGEFSNGRTAVANNDQITDGIYQAVKEALQDSDFNNRESEINVYLDSRKIAHEVKRVEKEQGVKIYGGNVSYAR